MLFDVPDSTGITMNPIPVSIVLLCCGSEMKTMAEATAGILTNTWPVSA